MLTHLLIILALIVLNGIFAMTELAVVSSRKSRLQTLSDSGSKGAKTALELKEDPSQFLSVVQIGITLIGVLSGAFSGALIAAPLGEYLSSIPAIGERGDDIAIGIVVVSVTYLSLVIGELVPKQIALRYADTVAITISRPIRLMARATRPLVWFLDISNRLVLRLLGMSANPETTVSQEEVKAIIAEGAESGVFAPEERKMMEGVLRLSHLSVKATMTHRQDIVWLQVGDSLDTISRIIAESQHSHFLLCEQSSQHVLGVVSAKDIVVQLHQGTGIDLRALAKDPLSLPETTSVHDAIATFRSSRTHIALVIDEYGSLEGIVTLKDILEAIVGIIPEPTDSNHPVAFTREDGSMLLDGLIPVYEAESLLDVKSLREEGADYTTLAGFVMHHLKRLPREGDILEWQNYRFEIVDMDERRIDKLLVKRLDG